MDLNNDIHVATAYSTRSSSLINFLHIWMNTKWVHVDSIYIYYRSQPKAGTGHKMLSVPFVFSTSHFQGPAFGCDKIVVIVTLLEAIEDIPDKDYNLLSQEKMKPRSQNNLFYLYLTQFLRSNCLLFQHQMKSFSPFSSVVNWMHGKRGKYM